MRFSQPVALLLNLKKGPAMNWDNVLQYQILETLKDCHELLSEMDNDPGKMPSPFVESLGELIKKAGG